MKIVTGITVALMLILTASAFGFVNPITPNVATGGERGLRDFDNFDFITICDMIGDNDGYGYGQDLVPDGATLPGELLDDDSYSWRFDNRSVDELAATNGAQFTDWSDRFDATFTHQFDIFQFDYLTEAYFTIDFSGQQSIFSSDDIFTRLQIGGIDVIDLRPYEQGAWGSGLFTFEIDVDMLTDGMLEVAFSMGENRNSREEMAIDFTRLCVTGVASSAIPEPGTMILLGLGTVGIIIRKRLTR